MQLKKVNKLDWISHVVSIWNATSQFQSSSLSSESFVGAIAAAVGGGGGIRDEIVARESRRPVGARAVKTYSRS